MELLKEIPLLEGAEVALGFFDGCHLGHIAVIENARRGKAPLCVLSVGERFPVTAADGSSIGSRLLTRDEECRVLSELGVDMLIRPDFAALRDMDGERFFNDIICGRLHARRVSCGSDFRFGSGASCGAAELERMAAKRGIEAAICREISVDGERVSSTRLRELLTVGDISAVNRMLGRSYGYTATVVHGFKLGRTLGTPTLNQSLPHDLYMPRFGVYASQTIINGERLCSVTNIGVKPTVTGNIEHPQPLSETWIPDWCGNLYGCAVRVELLGFLRGERRFSSLDELKAAIYADADAARAVFLSAHEK